MLGFLFLPSHLSLDNTLTYLIPSQGIRNERNLSQATPLGNDGAALMRGQLCPAADGAEVGLVGRVGYHLQSLCKRLTLRAPTTSSTDLRPWLQEKNPQGLKAVK